MQATARLGLGICCMCAGNTCDPGGKCEIALILEAVVTEAARGSIHNFATGIRAE
jgi:hypothetical protein